MKNQNITKNTDNKILKETNKPKLLPVENFLNFRESGQIPDFLNTKKSI